jgi:hypothetical protein
MYLFVHKISITFIYFIVINKRCSIFVFHQQSINIEYDILNPLSKPQGIINHRFSIKIIIAIILFSL